MTRSGSTVSLGRHIPIAVCAVLGMVTLLVASSAESGSRETRPPNVVVILVDDLGRADIGPPSTPYTEPLVRRPRVRRQQTEYPYQESDLRAVRRDASESSGFQTTPHIERLFEQGIVLHQYLTHTLCSPSRAGLLTGRHYTRVGSGTQVNGTLHLDVANVARDLQSSGYATAAFGKWHNGYPNFPADGNGAVVSGRDQTDPENDRFENYKEISWGPGVNDYGFDEWQGFYGGATDYFNRMSKWDNDTNWWTDQRYTPPHHWPHSRPGLCRSC